jgi:hypothetical protein
MSTLTLIALSLIGLVVLGLLTIVGSGVVGGALLLVDKLRGKETN